MHGTRSVAAVPEGHTIHRIARDQTKLLTGRTIRVSSPQGRFVEGAARIDGAVLESVEAYGKHLFHWWSTGEVGHVHLGLFGRFRVQRSHDVPPPAGEVRMRMVSGGDGEAFDVVDLSGPTACSVDPPDVRAAIIARLGPDPLRRDAKPTVAIDRMARSRQPIGALLLDQAVIAGVGNVFRAEALFVNGIDPRRQGQNCAPDELDALWRTIVAMLRKGVRDDRIATVDPVLVAIPRGRPRRGEATYVYHRDLCLRCGTTIRTVALAGRPCWFCPTCQPR